LSLQSIHTAVKHSLRSGKLWIWITLWSSCVSPIEIPVSHLGGHLVVSGQVSPIEDQNVIQLGLTADIERLPFPLSGAAVMLVNDLGESAYYEEDATNAGYYRLINATGVPGRTYHVQILYNGEAYHSQPEKMPESVGEISTYYEVLREEFTDLDGAVVTDNFINIYANSTLPVGGSEAYLKWGVEEAFLLSPTDFPDPFGYVPPPCFIVQNADPQRIPLFDAADLKTPELNDFLIGSRIIDWTFQERHYFTSYQTSLTKDAYEYWRKVNILSNQVGSIFDTPPAKIKGNIFNPNDASEEALGYFQAVNQTFDRFYILKANLPFTLLTSTCTFDNRDYNDYPTRCLDCTSVRNSSFTRPDWF